MYPPTFEAADTFGDVQGASFVYTALTVKRYGETVKPRVKHVQSCESHEILEKASHDSTDGVQSGHFRSLKPSSHDDSF